MIVGITGHRPVALGGYDTPNSTYDYIVAETEKLLVEHKPTKVITGMCIGYDQWVAELVIKLGIPFVAAVPFIGQELAWMPDTQTHYRKLIHQAEHIEVVSRGGFASWKMQARNKWIVEHCDLLIAAFSGAKGGTANCVEYAREHNRRVIVIDPAKAPK